MGNKSLLCLFLNLLKDKRATLNKSEQHDNHMNKNNLYSSIKNATLIIAIASLALNGCKKEENTSTCLKLVGIEKTIEFDAESFSRIKIKTPTAAKTHTNVVYSDVRKVEIVTYDQVYDKLSKTIENDTLKITSDFCVTKSIDLTINIYTPKLKSIDILSDGTLSLKKAEAEELTFNISNDCNVTSEINADSVTINILDQGNSEFTISGETEKLSITVDGYADIFANSLESQEANVFVNGVSDKIVVKTDSLHAKVIGYGNIYYIGSPSISDSSSLTYIKPFDQ